MKKANIYCSTIFWTSALTALIGCSYYRANNMVEAISESSKSEKQIEQSNRLSELNKDTNIYNIIIKYRDRIKKCLQVIEDSKSIFSEENINLYIKKFEELLDNNEEQLNNSRLLSLPMIDCSSRSTNDKNAQHLNSQSNDRKRKHTNPTYLPDLKNMHKDLSDKINEIEQNLPIKRSPDTTQLSEEEEEWNMTEQEDKDKKRKRTLEQIIPFICCSKETTNKVHAKDKNTTLSRFNKGIPAKTVDCFILDNLLSYHDTLFNLLTIHSMNASILQEKIKREAVEEQCKAIYNLIRDIYTTSIKKYRDQLKHLLQRASSNKPKKNLNDNDNDINNIKHISEICFRVCPVKVFVQASGKKGVFMLLFA